jgi:hypothetical protein
MPYHLTSIFVLPGIFTAVIAGSGLGTLRHSTVEYKIAQNSPEYLFFPSPPPHPPLLILPLSSSPSHPTPSFLNRPHTPTSSLPHHLPHPPPTFLPSDVGEFGYLNTSSAICSISSKGDSDIYFFYIPMIIFNAVGLLAGKIKYDMIRYDMM